MIDLLDVFDRLDSVAKQDILQQEEFQLTPPKERDDDDEDTLGEQSTNDAIELTEEIKNGMRTMRNQ
jgi:hypothetical protein